MPPTKRIPTHPGEVLLQEFLEPLGLTQTAVKDHLGIPMQRLNELCRGKRGVTPETAWLLAQALGTTPEFWMNLQSAYELARSRPRRVLRKLPASLLSGRGTSRNRSRTKAPAGRNKRGLN